MKPTEAASGLKKAISVVVLVALLAFVGVIWSSLGVMVTTMKAPVEALPAVASADALLEAAAPDEPLPSAMVDDAPGALVEQVQAFAGATQVVGAVADGAGVTAPPPPPPDPVLAQASAGSCAAASDQVLTLARYDQLDAVWRCFGTASATLPTPDALAATLANLPPSGGGAPVTVDVSAIEQGVDARLAAVQDASAADILPYLQQLLGAAALASMVQGDMSTELALAEWAAGVVPPTPGSIDFLRDRIRALSGALSGAPGALLAGSSPGAFEHLDAQLAGLLARPDLPDGAASAHVEGLTLGVEDPPDALVEAAGLPVDPSLTEPELPAECPLEDEPSSG